MKNDSIAYKLKSRINALCSLIFIKHYDFDMVDLLLKSIKNDDTQIYEFHNAFGGIDFDTKRIFNNDIESSASLENFLKDKAQMLNNRLENNIKGDMFIVLKDISQDELKNTKIKSLLKYIAQNTKNIDGYNCTIFVISPLLHIEPELEHLITIFEIPNPSDDEIETMIKDFVNDIDDSTLKEVALSFRGMSKYQITQMLYLIYQSGGEITKNDSQTIIDEKKQLIKKQGGLEIINTKENIQNLGGLKALTKWLTQKAKIMQNLPLARQYKVDTPKGVMIVGMPGCGKSLIAKASANLFGIPLIRLDVGALLGKYIGQSEENMQRALKLSEDISPCVLWIDEIEKAFSGIGNTQGHEVTTRLFGQFLTWLQKKIAPVFVLATANNIETMPPEFLRKGRFDEIFFVDLPDKDERKEIIKIHLAKREKSLENIDLNELAQKCEGFSGADIESAIKECIESNFCDLLDSLSNMSKITTPNITTEDLLKHIQNTKSISKTLKDKIQKIREKIQQMDIKPAKGTSHSHTQATFVKNTAKSKDSMCEMIFKQFGIA